MCIGILQNTNILGKEGYHKESVIMRKGCFLDSCAHLQTTKI